MSVQDQKPSWALEFKIDDPTWESLLRDSLTQNSTPLALAFERGLVNELLYIKQQQKLFDLTALNGDFFNTPPPAGCFEGYDYATCKKEGVIPIAQWDNQTLFAKIHGEKIPFEETILNGVFLLAPWSAMKKWFMTWDKNKSILDSPQGLNVKTSSSSDALANISFGNITITPQENSSPVIAENEKTQVPAMAPEPVMAFPVAANVPVPTHPPLPKINASVPNMLPPLPVVAQTVLPYPNIPLPDLKNAMNPEIPSITTITSLSHLSGTIGSIPPLPIEQVSGRAQFVQNYDDLCTVIFGCWKNYFDKSVILKYENSKLTSDRWDGEWASPDFRKTLEIDTSRPSIFKIVLNSEHPYHGYIVSNDINKKFFDECNKGQLPDFVNIFPLVVNKTIVGMILGVAGIVKSKKISLNQLEDHTHLFNEQLLRLMNTIPKAG